MSTTEAVKEAHRRFPTGVTVVTTSAEGKPYGLAVNAFASVSIDPPVALVCVAATSSTHPHLFKVDHLGVNVLSENQGKLLGAFARSGGDKFADVSWSRSAHGTPKLDGYSAFLELELEKRLQAYTHTIFTGRVLKAEVSSNPPMIYLGAEPYRSTDLTPLATGDAA